MRLPSRLLARALFVRKSEVFSRKVTKRMFRAMLLDQVQWDTLFKLRPKTQKVSGTATVHTQGYTK